MIAQPQPIVMDAAEHGGFVIFAPQSFDCGQRPPLLFAGNLTQCLVFLAKYFSPAG